MPVTRDDHELWAAARVISMHTTGDGCAQCGPNECRMYRWAAARLARWEKERGRCYQTPEPAWRGDREVCDG